RLASHFSSGYCIVTLVRPNSMFLKCLIVMARPATIAGKYMRSRQFRFGRGTVMAILIFLYLFVFVCYLSISVESSAILQPNWASIVKSIFTISSKIDFPFVIALAAQQRRATKRSRQAADSKAEPCAIWKKRARSFRENLPFPSAIFRAMLSPERSKWSRVVVFFVNDSMRSRDQVANSKAR